MTDWFEEPAPADLEELLDRPMHESGATRFELMAGEMIEQADPALGVQLYDGTLAFTRDRDPDNPDVVVATVFERESGAGVAELRIAWNSFFRSWLELLRIDGLEAAVRDAVAVTDPEVRADLIGAVSGGGVTVRVAEDDPDVGVLSVDGFESFGRAHRHRLTRPVE